MKPSKFWIFISLTIFLENINGYNILVLFPYEGVSHFMVYEPLFKELAHRGHNMTVLSHFPLEKPIENYHDISLKGLSEIFLEKFSIPLGKSRPLYANYVTQIMIHEKTIKSCDLLGAPQVMSLLKSKVKFDLILQEHFTSDCFFAINHILKLPQVGLSTCTMLPMEFNRMGAPMNPSYNVVNLHKFSEKMTFFERVQNTVAFLIQAYILPKVYIRNKADEIVKKYLGEGIPPVEEIARNTSVLLVNSHFSINRPKPFPPNIIEVSGLHVKKPKRLPQDIETFINGSDHGVIYFSMGSVLKGSTLPDEYRKMILNVFKKFPQRILWKYENDTMIDKPDNVMIRAWLPQTDLLGHPNVKGFISHCGLLGMIEAVHFAVPLVCIPFNAEQHTNAKLLAMQGSATVLDSGTFNEEAFSEAVKFLLDSKTKGKMDRTSRYYHDRPMSPIDTAIWWIEYVARNGGAETTRSSVLDMPLYQSMLLDVGLFLISILLITILVIYKIIKIIIKLLLGETKKVKVE